MVSSAGAIAFIPTETTVAATASRLLLLQSTRV